MNYLSINELIAAGRDLLGKRRAALARVPSSAVYIKLLEATLTKLEALPDALRGLPRAQLLRLLDRDHDGLVALINVALELLTSWPDPTEAMQAAAAALEAHYAVAYDSRRSYAEEAQLARERGQKLAEHRAVFDAIPMPDGGTLTALIERYVAAGTALGDNLSGRADDLVARGDASDAAALRGRVMGLLGELRTAVRREVEADSTLPASLEGDIFGYLDELTRLAAARAPGAPTGPPTPA